MNYLPHNLMVGNKLMRCAIGVEKQTKSDFIFSTRGVSQWCGCLNLKKLGLVKCCVAVVVYKVCLKLDGKHGIWSL